MLTIQIACGLLFLSVIAVSAWKMETKIRNKQRVSFVSAYAFTLASACFLTTIYWSM